jgi:hypothetical protein
MRDTLTVIGNPIATASGQIRPAVDKGPAAGLVGRRRLRWIVPVAARTDIVLSASACAGPAP